MVVNKSRCHDFNRMRSEAPSMNVVYVQKERKVDEVGWMEEAEKEKKERKKERN